VTVAAGTLRSRYSQLNALAVVAEQTDIGHKQTCLESNNSC